MKKIYVSAVAMMVMSTMGFAQIQQEVGVGHIRGTIHKGPAAGVRAATDTLGWGTTPTALASLPCFACVSGNVFNYGLNGEGGYMYGVNTSANNFDGNAQGYVYSGSAKVEGVLMLFVGKSSGVNHLPTASFNVLAYNWSATGATDYNGGTPQPCPGPSTTAATTTFLFDNVDTNFLAFNVATFPVPPTLTNDFAVGVTGYQTLKNTYSDTIGFLADDQGDAQGLNYVFHKVGTTWYQTASIFTFSSQPADNNIALFPIIENVTSVEEAGFFEGIKMWPLFPNPSNGTSSTLNFELERESGATTLKVIDMKGAIVSEYNLGSKPAGKHSYQLNTSNLESGAYYFMMTCDRGTLTQKFVVER